MDENETPFLLVYIMPSQEIDFYLSPEKSRADLYQKMMMGISIANTKWGASVIEGA